MVFICPAEVAQTAPCEIKARWLWRSFDLLITFSLFLLPDSALDDFVLTHCVFIPNGQLCPVLMAQYPFRITPPRCETELKRTFPVCSALHCFDL